MFGRYPKINLEVTQENIDAAIAWQRNTTIDKFCSQGNWCSNCIIAQAAVIHFGKIAMMGLYTLSLFDSWDDIHGTPLLRYKIDAKSEEVTDCTNIYTRIHSMVPWTCILTKD